MAVDFIAITQDQCLNCIGGIARTALVDCEYIDFDATTVDADGHIIAIAVTLAGAGKAVELVYDKDETAFYNSTGERTGKRYRANQEAFMKFECTTTDKLRAAELLKNSCCIVAVHQLNSGEERVQGIDVREDPDGSGYIAVRPIQECKATPSELSDTSANADRIEITLNSVSRNVNTALGDPSTFGIQDFLDL